MKIRWWIIAAVVAVLVIAVFWTAGYRESQYEDEAILAWTDLQTKLDNVNDEATRKDRDEKQYDVDFTATKIVVQGAKNEFDKHVKFWKAKKVPKKFREFNTGFVDLLGKSTAVLQSIIVNSSIWSEEKTNDLDTKVADLTSAQSTAYSSWPAGRKTLIQPDRELLGKVTKAFNATRQARKKAEEAKRRAEAEAEERARRESQRLVSREDPAVEEMRSIMREYLSARDYFNTIMDAGPSDPYVFGEQCVAGRMELINRLAVLDLPNDYYREARSLFVSGVKDAIEAIRIKCRTGNGRSEAARRAAGKIRRVRSRLGM